MTLILLLFLPGLIWGLLSWKFTLANRWIRFWCLLLSVDLSLGLYAVLSAFWAWYWILPCMLLCAALGFFVCWQVLVLAFRKWADRPLSEKSYIFGFICDSFFGILASAFLCFLFLLTPLANYAAPIAPQISVFTAGSLTAGVCLTRLTSDTEFIPSSRPRAVYPKQRFLSLYDFLIDRVNGEQEKREAAERVEPEEAEQESVKAAEQAEPKTKKKKRKKNRADGKEKSVSAKKTRVQNQENDNDEQ